MPNPTQRPDDPTDKGVVRGLDEHEPHLPRNRSTGAFPGNDDLRGPDDALRAVKLGRALRARDHKHYNSAHNIGRLPGPHLD